MSAADVFLAVLALATVGALGTILAIVLLNIVTFPRLRVPTGPADPALAAAAATVSVCIPARDEAATIGATLAGLRAQEPPVGEILVLDDGSSDGTAAIATAAAAGDPRVRVLPGEPLPDGWAGKPWACAQLAAAATGGRLLFTDADTRWMPGAVAALLAEEQRTGADLLTAWPTQETVTPAERLVVPLIAFAILGYLPVVAVHRIPSPAFAAAVGQCLLFRRAAYDRAGGHAAVRASVLDDVALARAMKATGGRLRVADAAGTIRCRMYRDWPGVRDGFAKNILAGYGGRVSALLAATAFHWAILVVPWLVLAAGVVVPGVPWWPGWPLACIGLGLAARALSAAWTGQRVRDALLLPVSALLLTAIAGRSIAWARSGGPRWKGRTLPAGGAGR